MSLDPDLRRAGTPADAPPHGPRAGAAARPDALLECLLALCRIHQVAATRESLLVGLPVDAQGLTVAVAERAAAQAGLETRLYGLALDELVPESLPAILILQGRTACVLLGFDDHGQARVLLPQAGMSEVRMARADLERSYGGSVLFARPGFRLDDRADDARGRRPARRGHWFWSAMLAQRFVLRDVLWAAVLVNLFAVALPMFTMNVYDRVVPNAAMETLWALAIGVVLAITGDTLIRTLRSRFVDEAAARIDVELSARLMQRVLGLRLEHRPASVGAFASTLRGFEQVREVVASSTVTALVDLPFGLMFLGLIVWIAPWLALPVVVAFAVTVATGVVLQARLHALAKETWQASSQRNATLVESLAGLETIKAQGAEARTQLAWERTNEHLTGLSVRMRALSSAAAVSASWIGQACTVAIVVIGVYLITDRSLSMGALIAASMLSSRALAPSAQIVGLLMQGQGARTALESLDRLMSTPVERPSPDEAPPFVTRGTLAGAVEFRNVGFAYPGRDAPVLHDLSFRIAPGERVAFVGRAGCGKSTIQRLLLGLYRPTSGTILVDGIDIRQIDPAELRHHAASVAQDALLFHGTLRENIALGRPRADDAQVLAAARAAGLGAFVDGHELGLNMPVGERGEQLSGGQRQAVAVARALLRGGSMLCLDEPSSAMDTVAEQQLVRTLDTHLGTHPAPTRTLLLATHRRTLLPLVTRMIVIDEGRIVADGPREEVLAALDPSRATATEPTTSNARSPGAIRWSVQPGATKP